MPENQIPHREMVFVDAASGPQQRGYRNVAGFIQGDGTGYTTRQIVFLDKEYAPFQYFPAFLAPGAAVSLPIYSRYTWDHDGGYLIAGVSRADPSHAEPILIFPDGEFMSCPDESFADLRIPPYFQPLAEMQIVGIDLGDPVSQQAIVIDMETCEVHPFLVGQRPLRDVREISVSTQGSVAVRFYEPDDGIHLFSPDGEEVAIIPDASCPSWSRNGEWVAFNRDNEIHVVGQDGTDHHMVTEEACSRSPYSLGPPSWSPDGEWLAYSCPGIYRVNVETGEIVQLSEGGYYPVWRWDDVE